MHLLFFGSSLSKIDLESCTDLASIRSTIATAAQLPPHRDAPRLLCRGWMHPMTNGLALASMLDDLDPRPIFIDSKDLHSTWCNSAALRELGVHAHTPDPEGGCIARDPLTGQPSGLLSEAANVNIAWPHVARVASVAERVRYVRDAVNAYNHAGYTGITEMAMDETIWEAVRVWRETATANGDEVSIRLAAYWLIKPCKTDAENLAQVDRAIELHRQFNTSSSPDFRIAGVKLICDGVVDACTASLLEPYHSSSSPADGDNSSQQTNCDFIWPEPMLRKVTAHAAAAGLQCALHAIGDATVRMAINALATLPTPSNSNPRHRIEHLEVTHPDDAKRLGDLGITASVQPVHADPAILRAWPGLLGARRCGRAFAYGEFVEHGARLAIGTDAPTAPHWPLRNLYTATTRRSAREPGCVDTVNEGFRVGLLDGVCGATRGAAVASFGEGRGGSLGVGMMADFVVLDMQWDAERLLEAEVYQTVFGGRRVYQRGGMNGVPASL